MEYILCREPNPKKQPRCLRRNTSENETIIPLQPGFSSHSVSLIQEIIPPLSKWLGLSSQGLLLYPQTSHQPQGLWDTKPKHHSVHFFPALHPKLQDCLWKLSFMVKILWSSQVSMSLPCLKPHTGTPFPSGRHRLLNPALKLPNHFIICAQYFHLPLLTLR